MKFFVPKTDNDTQAEAVWLATKKFAEDTQKTEVSDWRIFSIAYHREGNDYSVEVGKRAPQNGELVIAILESTNYLVCTPYRGVVCGMPILVDKNKVEKTTDFQH